MRGWEWGKIPVGSALEAVGFRFGARGTHTSRTIMLRELTDLLEAVREDAKRKDYRVAVVEENALAKSTMANRQSSFQRLSELYGINPSLPLFRVFRSLWAESAERPLLAILCTLARDPLLRTTAKSVLELAPGESFSRQRTAATIRDQVGSRMNRAVVDAVVRRVGSSWTQSGHLRGHSNKVRTHVVPGAVSVAFALWLGQQEGRAGLSLFDSQWANVLDLRGMQLLPLALDAGRLGLLTVHAIGNIVEVNTRQMDPQHPKAR